MNPHELPIYQQRERIIKELQSNNVIVVESPTGSGKTTQIPLILHNYGFSKTGIVGVTQPRRIAAISVCEYIAKQLGSVIPGVAGYKMRFWDITNADTVIKIMTDGILLQELKADRLLSKYSVIMVDEAHERSLNIDFILGLLKQVLTERSDFKVIISSATINAGVFSNYFDGCPIIHIDAQIYPVDIRYKPLPYNDNSEILIEYIASIVQHRVQETSNGDILIFLPGERLITNCVLKLDHIDKKKNLFIVPLFGRLPKKDQERVFLKTPEGMQKVVIATNIAETSITIDNIKTVIDSGLSKINYYNPKTFTSSLIESSIAKASCNQRKGRAGRTAPGVCYRMYDKNDFNNRPTYTPEEIKRTDLSEVVLRMSELGITDFESFDFITHPGHAGIASAIETLRLLNAIDIDNELTPTGKLMVKFPLLPRFSRIIVEAIIKYHDVLEETIIAASFLSARSPFTLPAGEEIEARHAHHTYSSESGDFVTYVTLFNNYKKQLQESAREKFCKINYLEKQTMDELVNIVEQLSEIVAEIGIPILSGGSLHDYLSSVASGLIQFVCVKTGKNVYRSLTTDKIHIHPGSIMFRKSPSFIVAGEIVRTSRMFARSVSALKKDWLAGIHKDLAAKLLPDRRNAEQTVRPDQRKDVKKQDGILLFNKRYPVEPYKKNKKIVVIPFEDLRRNFNLFTQDRKKYNHLRMKVTYRSFSFHTGDRLASIMKAVPFMKPENGILDRPPQGNFEPAKEPEILIDNLSLLLCFCKIKRNSKILGFITLENDTKGTFWFKNVKSFHSAIDIGLFSLEMLADIITEKNDKDLHSVLNETYRKLTMVFES
ncbi:MAG: ATP-dependent RNA helicase [Bacteroidetes bacterium]|nr:ATP-dependent RNA helicase [Bacteroidota bacterium]